ncbi:MAG TPA: hypothetical protein DCR93_22000 [Cytophagales bacterium]|nr:hypothetical protein [Cytophagales bacterium]HAP62054.1 hypothetical protein [Cytophagales bacterium]
MKRLLLLTTSLALLFSCSSQAPQPDLDSAWAEAWQSGDSNLILQVAQENIPYAIATEDATIISKAYWRLGSAHSRLGQFAERLYHAHKAYDAASDLPPSEFSLLVTLNLGQTYKHLNDYKHAAQFIDESIGIAESLSSLSPEIAYKPYIIRGNLELLHGRPAAALPLFVQANQYPVAVKEQAIIFNGLGNAYYHLGHYEKAADTWQLGLSAAAQDDPGAIFRLELTANLAEALAQLDRGKEAEPLWRQAIAMSQGTRLFPYLDYGQWLDAQGREEEALSYYHQGLTEQSINLQHGELRHNYEALVNEAIELSEGTSSYQPRLYLAAKDAIISGERESKEVTYHSIVRETQNRIEKENAVATANLKRERTFWQGATAVLGLLFILGAVLFVNRKREGHWNGLDKKIKRRKK